MLESLLSITKWKNDLKIYYLVIAVYAYVHSFTHLATIDRYRQETTIQYICTQTAHLLYLFSNINSWKIGILYSMGLDDLKS